MEETGIVKEVIGQNAIVTVQRQSGCDSCPGGSICKMVGSEAEIEALNEARAKVGDKVRIEFKPYTYLKGTIAIYGIPSIMLVIGALFGQFFSKFFPKIDTDILSAISGFGFFSITFFLMKWLLKRQEGKKEYMPVIEEIIN